MFSDFECSEELTFVYKMDAPKPANLYVIFSSAGAFRCMQMMALFKSFRARHTVRVPFHLKG